MWISGFLTLIGLLIVDISTIYGSDGERLFLLITVDKLVLRNRFLRKKLTEHSVNRKKHYITCG